MQPAPLQPVPPAAQPDHTTVQPCSGRHQRGYRPARGGLAGGPEEAQHARADQRALQVGVRVAALRGQRNWRCGPE
eukprot:2394717-Alexandrium_andersonii.AAC.1